MVLLAKLPSASTGYHQVDWARLAVLGRPWLWVMLGHEMICALYDCGRLNDFGMAEVELIDQVLITCPDNCKYVLEGGSIISVQV